MLSEARLRVIRLRAVWLVVIAVLGPMLIVETAGADRTTRNTTSPGSDGVGGDAAAVAGYRISVSSQLTRVIAEQGESLLFQCPDRISSVQEYDEDLIHVDVVQGNPRMIRVTLFAAGVTDLVVTDEHETTFRFQLSVRDHDHGLKSILSRLYPGARISTVPMPGSVLLRGTVESVRHAEQVLEIAMQLFPTVLNQMNVASRDASAANPENSLPENRTHTFGRYQVSEPATTIYVYADHKLSLEFPAEIRRVDQSNRRVDVEYADSVLKLHTETGFTKFWVECTDGTRFVVRVHAEPDVSYLKQLVRQLYPNRTLAIVPVGGAVVLRGSVETELEKQQVAEVSEQFYPKVLNHLDVTSAVRQEKAPGAEVEHVIEPPRTSANKSEEDVALLRRDIGELHQQVRDMISLLRERENRATESLDVPSYDGNSTSGTKLLFFTASYCRPCQDMIPIVNRLKTEFDFIEEVDITQHPDISRRYGVAEIPTFVLVQDGKKHKVCVGKVSETRMRTLLTEAMSEEAE